MDIDFGLCVPTREHRFWSGVFLRVDADFGLVCL